jgi:hypothetical protein
MLVALCLARVRSDKENEYFVVTEERLRGLGSMRLRNVCRELGLNTLSLVDLFRREAFRF